MYKKSHQDNKRKIEKIKEYYKKLNSDEEKVKKYVREKITEWLSLSDKTRFQLQEKIYKKIEKERHEMLVEKILDYFEELNYINDDRFVENFIRIKYETFYGKTRIKNELKTKGINPDHYSYLFEEYDFKKAVMNYIEEKIGSKELTEKEITKLQRKLITKGYSFSELQESLNMVNKKTIELSAEEEQDMSEAIKFIEKQIRKGYGRKKIELDLKQKGIIYSVNIFDDFDFFEVAYEYKIKKFGKEKPSDFKVLQKQKNHLLSRGFTFEEINETY